MLSLQSLAEIILLKIGLSSARAQLQRSDLISSPQHFFGDSDFSPEEEELQRENLNKCIFLPIGTKEMDQFLTNSGEASVAAGKLFSIFWVPSDLVHTNQ